MPVWFISNFTGLSLSSDDDSMEFNGVSLSDKVCCQLKTQDCVYGKIYGQCGRDWIMELGILSRCKNIFN